MEEINVCYSFSYKGKPYKLSFHSSAQYAIPDKKVDIEELNKQNELIVRGEIQASLSRITHIVKHFFLQNLKVKYKGETVFNVPEYEIVHKPPMNE